MAILSKEEWDKYIQFHPAAHFLQCGAWGEVKAHYGWSPIRLQVNQAGAQVLFRQLPLNQTIAYIPKGPVGEPDREFWVELDRLCRSRNAIFLKVEPDGWEGDSISMEPELQALFLPSTTIQPRRTIVLDLTGGEEAILARMKQKTRYNIRLAEKKDVLVKPWRDFDALGEMFAVTAARDGFGVHTPAYYRRVFEEFRKTGQAEVFCACHQDIPLAAILVIKQGGRAWYVYGASNNLERNRMPAYLVQWEGIRWAFSHGCQYYDLWGIPDELETMLEENFETRSDGLWGVYRFKRGFGGDVLRSPEAWDRVYAQLPYRLYQWYRRKRSSAALEG